MKTIHGLRIYPQSVKRVASDGAPIFIHGRVSERYTDFYYAFRPLAAMLRGHVVAQDFGVTINLDGTADDPIPAFRERYGPAFVDADLKFQIMLLSGDEFERWGPMMHFCEGAFLPIFERPPAFALLERLYWGRNFRLRRRTWPRGMRGLLHMWDDIYWQLFTTERGDLDTLIRAHASDPKLKMFFVDLDREYPDPSNEELAEATLPGAGGE